MMLSIQIAKFKFHQYQLRAVSPNLMLTIITHYTVYGKVAVVFEFLRCLYKLYVDYDCTNARCPYLGYSR